MLVAHYNTPKAPATRAGRVELNYFEGRAEWVTGWRGTDDGGETWDSSWCWGHYFRDESEARADFAKRCERGY